MASLGATVSTTSLPVATTQYAAPTTGGTVNIDSGANVALILNPSGTLATLTVNFPSAPVDGDRVAIASSQIITALTMANGTMIGTLTSLAVAGFAYFIFSSTAGKWFRGG